MSVGYLFWAAREDHWLAVSIRDRFVSVAALVGEVDRLTAVTLALNGLTSPWRHFVPPPALDMLGRADHVMTLVGRGDQHSRTPVGEG